MRQRLSSLLPIIIWTTMNQESVGGKLCNNMYTCKNNGSCVEVPNLNYNGSSFEYCLCPGGWTGDSCEEKRACDLDCHEGFCQFPPGLPTLDENTNMPFHSQPSCHCRAGYSGNLCQHQNEVCPDGKLTCFNGSQCRTQTDRTGLSKEERRHDTPIPDEDIENLMAPYVCDCSVIQGDTPYVGRHCEHPPERDCSLLTKKKVSFCVNGGKCKDMTTKEGVHHGCHCPDDFEGPKCEFHKKTRKNSRTQVAEETPKQQQTGGAKENIPKAARIVVVFTIAGVVSVVILAVYHYRRRSRQEATDVFNVNDPCNAEIPTKDKQIV